MSLFRLLTFAVLLAVGIPVGYVATHINYKYVTFIAKRKWEGKSIESCLDLPPKYWSLIPKCGGEEIN